MRSPSVLTRRTNAHRGLPFLLAVGTIGTLILVHLEYFIKLNTDDAQAYWPLMARGMAAGVTIMVSVHFGIIWSEKYLRKATFLKRILVRSTLFTLIITFWLIVVNLVWFVIRFDNLAGEELVKYFSGKSYLTNMLSVFPVLLFVTGLNEIRSLHSRGQLMQFVLGLYSRPREVERIFCFIDLKDSTTIAERLGHVAYANFLRDYYSDITSALRETDAQIYQYVGDEIVLVWNMRRGTKNSNCIRCFFRMQSVIENLRPTYTAKYGAVPEIRAGLHGGDVVITWVGELKKEIVYIGDIVNTTARIVERCKKTGNDLLISETLLEKSPEFAAFVTEFVEETIPRGKATKVRLHRIAPGD